MKHPVAALLAVLCSSALWTACQSGVLDHADEAPGAADDVTACEDDTDCAGRALCRAGLCQEVGPGCVRKSECGDGLVCVEGECAPPPESCSSSEECPGALLCDGFSRSCFDPNASGCRSDGECALEPGCEGGCTCEADGSCAAVATPDPGDDEPPPSDDPPPPPSSGEAIDLGGFLLENREHEPPTQVGVIPGGTVLEPGQHLVIARDADRAAFEAYWGVSLDERVIFLNAQAGNSGVPIVNGGERWALVSPLGTDVDGVTIEGAQGAAYRRVSPSGPGSPASWQEADATLAVPGHTMLPSSGVGLAIAQWSDAPGSGSYVYEFVELYYAP